MVSTILLIACSIVSLRCLLQPHSDFMRVYEYGFEHTTDAVAHNSRYPNSRQTINWHALGFRFDLVRLVLYPRWISHGDNQTIEWGPVGYWRIAVPGWACIVVLAILPMRWLAVAARQRREAKIHAGICLRCGYDLRESPLRCPECGEPRPPALSRVS